MGTDWLTASPSAVPPGKRKLGRALSVSMAAHAGFVLLLIIGWSVQPTPVDSKPAPIRLDAVYIPAPGPMHGGGGNRPPASAKSTEVPRHDLPKPIPVDPQPVKVEPRDPLPVIDVVVQTNADALRYAGLGAISIGPGGLGLGPGAGPGRGPGLGPGRDGNTGDGPRTPGGDITIPEVIRSVDPTYTPAALVAKTSGTVELEVVVLANGTVGSVRVIKSLDTVNGLDQAAINAARQWLFRPSLQQGKPVDVVVKLILEFHIR